MTTHTKGQKYILSASISHEVGKVLDELIASSTSSSKRRGGGRGEAITAD
jgi:hypothetical protein